MEKTTTNQHKLSIIKKIALDILKNIENKIMNDECSDDYMLNMASKVNAEMNGYIREDELLNYDQAMKMLGISNRNVFNKICKDNKVENIKIKNVHVGFRKNDIECLALKIKD